MAETIIELAGHRQHVLDYLRDGPFPKRSIIDALDHSRSTVDRAVRELIDAGLVAEREGGYETTVTGVLALRLSRRTERNARALDTAAPMLRPLWKEEPIGIEFLREAEGTLLRESESVTPLSGLQSALRNASEIRALLPAVPTVDHLDLLRSRALRDDIPVRLVCSPELFERLSEQHPDWLRGLVIEGAGSLSTAAVPEPALYVVDVADRRVAFLLVYDGESPHALLRNGTAEAVEWADEWFAEHVAEARSARDRIEQIPPERSSDSPTPGASALGSRRASAASPVADRIADEESALLGAGFAVDGGRLRTPKFGAEGACTVSLWMLPYEFDDGWEILVKWDYLVVGYRHGQLYAAVYDPETETFQARVEQPVDRLDLARWTHIAYTYNESRARLYIDGDRVDEVEADYPLEIEPLGACLGYIYEDRDTGVHEPFYTGRLADVRFYETALDAETIQQLHRTTAPE